MPANIPHRIKQRRQDLSLSQDALAKACGVGQSTVANWERGGHIPRQATLHKIAEALKVDQAWLLSGQQASAGPVKNYLSRPILHIPIYDWPRNAAELSSAAPQSFVTLSLEPQDVFGLTLPQDMGRIEAGSVLIFTRNYDAEQSGLFLAVSKSGYELSEIHSESSEARLVYSLMAY